MTDQLCDSTTPGTIYDYRAQVLDKDHCVDFTEFKGKPVLFVNVATYWGYTYQYKGMKQRMHNFLFLLKVILILPQWPLELNALQEELKYSGFLILGFPSNQFGKQEPGAPFEILPGLK